ncbi:MAG: hypothetical protein FJ078_01135 [Cyanobacteria bacterium K_DeepCast_35m_m2_155]|nr:hypothetical protein [Cyanobacteria bacterium K_DeepCast_35m_m2_155]
MANNGKRCPSSTEFQGGLTEAFLAGYHAAVEQVREECKRPDHLMLTTKELEVMLRRQCSRKLQRWKMA